MKILLLLALLIIGCGGGWSRADRMEYLYDCETNSGVNKKRCECNLGYLQKKYWSLSTYHSHSYKWSGKWVNAKPNSEKRKKLKAKQKREIKEMHDWVNKCLRGY